VEVQLPFVVLHPSWSPDEWTDRADRSDKDHDQIVINKSCLATIYPDNLRLEVQLPKYQNIRLFVQLVLYRTKTCTPRNEHAPGPVLRAFRFLNRSLKTLPTLTSLVPIHLTKTS